jgi:hypothetical protein
MTGTPRMIIPSILVVLLWASPASGGQEYDGARRGPGVGAGKHWVQFTGRVLCSGATHKTQRTVSTSRFYQVKHRRGQVVMKVTAGASAPSYHSLWLNGGDQLFETLSAEENLFKDVEISGLLREYHPTMGIVDLPTVQVIGAEAKNPRESGSLAEVP